jgi:hypothetical protein
MNESKFGVGDITGKSSIEFWMKLKKGTKRTFVPRRDLRIVGNQEPSFVGQGGRRVLNKNKL